MRSIVLQACCGVLLLALAGCGRDGEGSVQELAAALREQGIRYQVSETAALSGVEGEGLRLVGPELRMEMYRIPDEEQRRLAAAAAVKLARDQAEAGTEALKPYLEGPFLIIVRREPSPGAVRAALEAALAR